MSLLRFLHLADVHLGATPYHHPERTKDFFRALHHAVRRHAIDDPVDFVLVAGDLFDKRSIEPRILTHAMVVLKDLQDAGIPVFAVEGNHDRAGHSTPITWLRYLSDWGMLKLLEPEHAEDGTLVLRPWDDQEHLGGYIDFKGVRIVGSRWYGASTAQVIEPLARAIKDLPATTYTLLMLHTGLDGYLDHYSGGVSGRQLSPLREAGVRYLALGHIHMRYEEDGWIYNPGSLESGHVGEYALERGAYRVTIDLERGTHHAVHLQDHPQRPFHRLAVDLTLASTPEEALSIIERTLVEAAPGLQPRYPTSPEVAKPVVELTLSGRLTFKRHELDLDAVQELVVRHCAPLLPRLRYDAIPTEYAVAPGAAIGLDRPELERRVVHDLVARDGRYQERSDDYGALVLGLKQRALEGSAPAEIAAYLRATLEGLGP